jgi:hypothetical protein
MYKSSLKDCQNFHKQKCHASVNVNEFNVAANFLPALLLMPITHTQEEKALGSCTDFVPLITGF